jgi:hypothetical protein
MFKLILNIEKKEFNPEFGYLIIFQEKFKKFNIDI